MVNLRPDSDIASSVDIGAKFADYAGCQPDAPAILAPGRAPLTFGGLFDQQRYVGEVLGTIGIRRGVPVAVVLPRGAEMAVACAVLPAAATVVPLDPGLSGAEYETLFRRCRAGALLTADGTDHPAHSAAIACGMARLGLRPDTGGPAGRFTLEPVSVSAEPDRAGVDQDFAYILATSGTTAERKLVPMRHRHILAYAQAMKGWLRFSAGDVSFHLSPMHFAHGIKSVLMVPLLCGTSMVCPRKFDIDSLFQMFAEYRPTWLGGGFTLYRDILAHVDRYREIVGGLNLRFVRSSFGRLSDDELARLEAAFNTTVVVPLSSTETCLIACNPLPPLRRKPGTVGVPVVNEVEILGEDGRFCGPGIEGEIVVRGPMVFDGYLDDAAANKAAFFEGWYRTGDVGFFDDDHYLTLVGRIKEMINRGGEKIAPAEIDAVLISHPDVADAAAFSVPHPTLGEIVGAAVVSAPGADPDERDILRYVEARLSPVKVPRQLAFVAGIPRGGTGKIQRAALAEAMAGAPAAPREALENSPSGATSTEAVLRDMWGDILKQESVNPDGDFFLLGGDSLMAAQLVLAVNERFQVEIPLEAVFGRAKTVRTMAAIIDGMGGEAKRKWTGNVDLHMASIDARTPIRARGSTKGGRGTAELVETLESAESMFVMEKGTGFRVMRPNIRFGCVQTNSHGYRSPEIPLRKPEGTVRIAFLGTSTTFGSWNHGEEESWPHHAVSRLRQANPALSWDYVNTAWPGQGIRQMAHQFGNSISKFQPDLIIIMPGNKSDIATLARRRIGFKGVPSKLSAFGRWSPFTQLVEKNLVILLRQLKSFSTRGKLQIDAEDLRDLSSEYERELQALCADIKKTGATVALAMPESKLRRDQTKLAQIRILGAKLYYYPYLTVAGYLDLVEEYQRATRATAARCGAILVDLAGVLPGTSKYYEDTSHFTCLGNRQIGEFVARTLGEADEFRDLIRRHADAMALK